MLRFNPPSPTSVFQAHVISRYHQWWFLSILTSCRVDTHYKAVNHHISMLNKITLSLKIVMISPHPDQLQSSHWLIKLFIIKLVMLDDLHLHYSWIIAHNTLSHVHQKGLQRSPQMSLQRTQHNIKKHTPPIVSSNLCDFCRSVWVWLMQYGVVGYLVWT